MRDSFSRDLPDLPTLNATPSWCNLHGNLDRSACTEIRLSDVRRAAHCVIPNGALRPDGKGRTQRIRPLPNERPARNGRGRIATGVFLLELRHLQFIRDQHLPRELAGDWRTERANVMRGRSFSPDRGFRFRVKRNGPAPNPPDAGIPHNPNKGASRSKIIGVSPDFTQPLRMEKWIFPRRIRPAYYLICPGTFLHRKPPINAPDGGWDPRLPPLSTLPNGRKARGCPQRVLKLMLVQCTEDEKRDALTAELWIDSIPPAARARMQPQIQHLIRRYGPIMEPRCLMCARCLGVKYGNHPETVRQGWRRRQGKL